MKMRNLWGLLLFIMGAVFVGCSNDPDEPQMPAVKEFDQPGGVFVLNEGNMTTENGSLIYISPEGTLIQNAYKNANGTELGNVTQDMCIRNGKIYIISQNGDTNPTGTKFNNDGMLIIANAKTLKKEMAFTKEELSELDWPTNIAALDDQHIFIRDKKGIWKLNAETKELTFIKGTEKAPIQRFSIADNKVYGYKAGSMGLGSKIFEFSAESEQPVSYAIPGWGLTYGLDKIYGIKVVSADKVWVMAFEPAKPSLSLGHLDANTKKLVIGEDDQRLLSKKPNNTATGTAFTEKDGIVYYVAEGTTDIYEIDYSVPPVFPKEPTEIGVPKEKKQPDDHLLVTMSSLDENAGLVYNVPAIDPISGLLYVNTLKGFGADFTTNHIWVLNPKDPQNPVKKYEDVIRFPAVICFNPGK